MEDRILTPEQCRLICRDIRSSGISPSPFTASLLIIVEEYAEAELLTGRQQLYLLEAHAVHCTMNKEWLYPAKETAVTKKPPLKALHDSELIFSRGKYKGKSFAYVKANHLDYLMYLTQVHVDVYSMLQPYK